MCVTNKTLSLQIMTKRLFFIICIFVIGMHSMAQTDDNTATNIDSAETTDDVYQAKVRLTHTDFNSQYQPHTSVTATAAPDSLHLPPLNRYGNARLCSYPSDLFGLYDWNLHSGLNMNIGVSVFATFGKHAPKSIGFGNNISAMYATALTSRLSLAVGGYFSNTYWAAYSYRNAGVSAVLAYKFDEHWEAYLYGQKSLTDTRMPMPLYDMDNIGDRIGAAVRYNFSPSFSIQMSVSRSENREPYFADFMRDVLCR